MEKIGNMQITDNKENKFFCFPMISMACNVSRDAQMAESVDALVSNTSGFTSIPVRPRVWVQR